MNGQLVKPSASWEDAGRMIAYMYGQGYTHFYLGTQHVIQSINVDDFPRTERSIRWSAGFSQTEHVPCVVADTPVDAIMLGAAFALDTPSPEPAPRSNVSTARTPRPRWQFWHR